ncbi:MAG TPA: hypothetical protein VK184_20760 [Nostocaceae cyanobacterium]|nr:hypothetical protein [Nostocaceae cyanobacterium]
MFFSKKAITNKSIYSNLTASVLATAGLFLTSLPSMAVSDAYYNNQYRHCVGKLLRADFTAQAAAQGCAGALRPVELSDCVTKIKGETQITPLDALGACRNARRPKDFATCVVGISQNTEQAVNPEALRYCGRSLLPVNFASCVVGLRREIDLAPIQALDTCIDANDRTTGIGAWSTTPRPNF